MDAFEGIAAERPAAAREWLGRALDTVAKLQAFPDLGRPVPELARSDYRQLLVKPYRIVYRRGVTVVVMLTVRHVRQDWDPREISAV